MTPLSPHFSLEEFCASQTASRLGIYNKPTAVVYARLQETAARMEKVRELLGDRPIVVSSAFRSPQLNRAIGGAAGSAHQFGYAVDFTCPQFGDPFTVAEFLSERLGVFDQLIYEFQDWVHLSFAPTLRRDVLTIFDARTGYLRGIVAKPSNLVNA
jgi:zinc D-Ala-D-Ala carboxypeptidase